MRRRQQTPPATRDAGMTLVEVVVALGLLAIMSTAVITVLLSTITLTRDDQARLEAVSLASRELEIARDGFASVLRGPSSVEANRVVNPSPLPGGTAGEPLVVNNVPYTVVRTAQWTSVGSTASACDDGTNAELAYLKVKVEVSWPELGSRPPVTMDTLMTPPKGTYSSLLGHIGLKVVDSAGQPKAGVTVTAQSATALKTGVTAADGCVLLDHLPDGAYTVTASQPHFVNLEGDPTASVTATVQPGQLWRGTIEYDESATISVAMTTDDGFALPTGDVPVTLMNSGLQPTGLRVVTGSGNPRLIPDLWPYPSGYGVWAGGCQDADPALSGTSDLPVTTSRGGVTAATVRLVPFEVHTLPGATVRLQHAADSLCPAVTELALGTASPEGILKTSAPAGVWTVVVPGVTASPDVALSADNAVVPPVVSVP